MKRAKIIKMYNALHDISHALSIRKLKKSSNKLYGLDPEEAIEMACEDLILRAKIGIKGISIKELEELNDYFI